MSEDALCANCSHKESWHDDRAVAACDGDMDLRWLLPAKRGPVCDCEGWKRQVDC